MTTILLSILLFGLFVFALSLRMILFNEPEVRGTCASQNPLLKSEEESFGQTLDKGLEVFDSIINNLDKNIILGEDAFKLYDTYGFPIDLTRLMAKEKNISVDEKVFLNCMNEQKERSKSKSDFKILDNDIEWIFEKESQPSIFIGYSESSSNSKIIKFRNNELEHKEIAYDSGATKKGLYGLLDKVIKTSSRIAITISEKI